MKTNKFYKIFYSLLVLLTVCSSCKKESDSIFTLYKGLNIDFNEALGNNEVYVEFNLAKPASGANMAKVVVTETGGTTPVYSTPIPFAQKYSYYSGVLAFTNSSPSTASYKITVFDEKGLDITSSVTITYPAGVSTDFPKGKQVTSSAVLISDKDNPTFEEGTTVYIDYNIASANDDFKSVWLESFDAGATEPSRVVIATLQDDAPDKRNFRGAVRVKLGRSGGNKFRVYATNANNDYVGDGYKTLYANVKTGFELTANKFIYAADTASSIANPDFTSACFYSILKKKSYSYNEAKANSADIDFGIYLVQKPNTALGNYNLNIYTPNDTGNPVSGIYDFSTWTKRTTKFTAAFTTIGAVTATIAFNNLLVSGLAIQTQASVYAPLMTRNRVVTVGVGTLMFFRTQEGKFGAVYVNAFGKDYLGRNYANIDVKIEK